MKQEFEAGAEAAATTTVDTHEQRVQKFEAAIARDQQILQLDVELAKVGLSRTGASMLRGSRAARLRALAVMHGLDPGEPVEEKLEEEPPPPVELLQPEGGLEVDEPSGEAGISVWDYFDEPLYDRVLVKQDPSRAISGTLFAGKEAAPFEGTVVAVGVGYREDGALYPMRLQVGDRVIFSQYGHTEIILRGKKYVLLREQEVFVRLRRREPTDKQRPNATNPADQ